MVEGLVDECKDVVVVILVLWCGGIARDECRDDVDDGRGVKVETPTLLLGLEMGFGGCVGRGGVGGALL